MVLSSLPKRPARDETLSVRISTQTKKRIKALCDRHNLTQADVIEDLVNAEYERGDDQQEPEKKSKRP